MEQSINLYFREGSSDKVYQAELKQVPGGWAVNFAYGRRGSALKSDTKTVVPVNYDIAKVTYDKLVKRQLGKGYTENTSGKIFSGAISSDRQDTGVRPQLLNPIEERDLEKYFCDSNWIAQEKFDGHRRLLFCKGAQSYGSNRKGLRVDITDQVLTVIQDYPEGTILDGEDLGNRIVIFDAINFKEDYQHRYLQLMNMWIPSGDALRLAYLAESTDGKRSLYKRLKEEKAEGIVFKDHRAHYSPGRPASGGTQVKFKFVETASCVVIGRSPAKRSIELAVYDGIQLVRVGNVTVYPNQEIPKNNVIVEVKYLYYFPGGSLYQPVLLYQRNDIDYTNCMISQLKVKQVREEVE